jgi:tripartite-type tricarboxylate transporter receptor subunit TctC
MPMPRFVLWTISVGMIVLGAGVASGQTYPNKPIRIVTTGTGGGNDFIARLIAQGITGPLGQQVIVDNRAGIIAAETVAKALPDGYTLLVIGSSLWIEPLMRANVAWDPVRDFLPITLAERSPNVLVVHPSVAAKSVKELIVLAKARPGELNYASNAIGGSSHLAGELLKAMAGINIVHVPYKGTAQTFNDLLASQVQIMITSLAAVTPHVKSGRLRALAVTTAQPSALAPDLPTVAATVPGYEAAGMTTVFAPAKMPATIIDRLNQEIVLLLNRADVKEKLFNIGAEAIGSSPQDFAAAIKSDMARLGKVIKDGGIRVE